MSEQPENAVAIVGMGAVFPGAGDAATFWRNIQAGTDSVTDVTPDRWDPAVYCDEEQSGAARFYTRRGGFLGEVATFNPHPFGIMPSSVDGTEPDQLLMLRAAAAAITDGGALPERERVGVIVGRGGYLTPGLTRLDQRVSAVHQLSAVLSDLLPDLGHDRLAEVRTAFAERLGRDDPQDSIGLVPNFAASRLANRFDLRGPAYTVDAACASSLIAVDHAVRELTSGRCDAVLAGGVHTCHHPTLWSVFTRLRVLSPAGVIRPFDAAADGTLLSEGAGAVLLKRLADARAAGDRIYAVIRGVGVSSDGRATSMLNPLVAGQELAIRRAWAAAGLEPAAPCSLGLLEAHGTATPTGDRAELTALGRVFGPPAGGSPGGGSSGRQSIGIGTVKSMIGHAMPAAGIAGLIKAAFAVHDAVLPPTLHVDKPNPAMAATRFAPVTRAQPWDDGPVRRAAVSAFGFGGINAHVILESDRAGRPAAAVSGGRPRGGRDAGQPIAVQNRAGEHCAGQHVAGQNSDIQNGAVQNGAVRNRAVGGGHGDGGNGGGNGDGNGDGGNGDGGGDGGNGDGGNGDGGNGDGGNGDGGNGEAVLRLAAGSVAELAAQLRSPDAVLLAQAAAGRDGAPGDGPCRLAVVAPDERRLALARKIAEGGAPWRGRSDIWFAPRPLLRGPEQVAFLFPGFEPAFAPRTEGVAEAFGLPPLRLHSSTGDRAGTDRAAGDRAAAAGHAAERADRAAPAAADRDNAVWQAVDVVAVGRLFTAALGQLGITPGALAGHSLGEWTAMVAADVFPDIDQFIASAQPGIVELPDVVYLALGTGAARAAELINGLGETVLTHDNCPRQSVVCGPAAQISTAARRAREAGILAQAMPFRTGFHSPAYAPHVPPMARALAGLAVRGPGIPVWSATTLAPIPDDPDAIKELVLRHLVESVRFRQLTELLHDAGIRAFVQVGPGSLTGFTDDTLAGRDYLAVATASQKRDGLAQLRRAAAALWAEGLSPDFSRLLTAGPARPAGATGEARVFGAVGATGATGGLAGTAGGLAGTAGGRAQERPAVRYAELGVGWAGLAVPAGAAGPAVSPNAAGTADQAGQIGAGGSAGGDHGDRAGDGAGPGDGHGGVRLQLGTPLVRLAGAVQPLHAGHAGDTLPGTAPGLGSAPVPAAVPAGFGAAHPALAELNALLNETAAAAQSVVTALARPAVPRAAPAAAAPATSGHVPGGQAYGDPALGRQVPGGQAYGDPALGRHVPGGQAYGDPALGGQAHGRPVRGASVLSAQAPASPAALGAPSGTPASGAHLAEGEIRVEREFSLRTMPEVADHCLILQPDGWPEDSDRFPVVPLTALLEIMSDAALELAPGRLVTGFQQVRAMRWLTVAPPTRTAVRAAWIRPDDGLVRVTIEGFASGYVVLADRYPAAPPPDETPLRDRRSPPLSARELYADRWMFHGPRFAGVASVSALAADGITGSVLSMPIRGALLDSVGQIIGHWMQMVPSTDQNVLPTGIGAVRRFGPQPPAGQPLEVLAWIRELTDTEMRADAEVRDAGGRVWCRVEGWTTRRFSTDDAIVNARRYPAGHGLSVLGPDGWTVAFERWQDMASRELVMRLYLNAAERAEYERLPPAGQRRWLLGRIAVKDAVRRLLWDRGAGPVFPAELTVAESAAGVRVLGPFAAPPVSLALSPDAPGRPYAAAIAGTRAGLAIQRGSDGSVLITEPGRAALPVEIAPDGTIPVTIPGRGGPRVAGVHPTDAPGR